MPTIVATGLAHHRIESDCISTTPVLDLQVDSLGASRLNDQQIHMKKQIFKLAGVFAGLAGLALVLPRWAGRTQEGLAAGATAAVTFLAFGGLATLVAFYLFFIVARNFRQLAPLVQFVGVLPLLMTLIVLVAVWAYLIA